MTQAKTLSGEQKLAAFFDESDVTKRAFADALGINPPYLSQILSGYRAVKSLAMAAKIEAATGEKVTMCDFLDKDDRARVDEITKSRQA